MNNTASPYQVPPEPGRWRAFTLAALVHALLLGFLWIGVSWQSETPVGVEAEIWSADTRLAAPPPPEPVAPKPAPDPPKAVATPEPAKPKLATPDIALEKEKKRKQEEKIKQDAEREKKKLADEKQRKQEREDKKKLAEENERKLEETLAAKRAQARRTEDLRRMTTQAGNGTSGDAEKTQGSRADPGYAKLVGAKIKSNTIFTPMSDMAGNPAVEFQIDLLPDGSLRDVRMLKSSGISPFDQAVKRAIDKSVPFPADASGKVPSSFILSHKPKDN